MSKKLIYFVSVVFVLGLAGNASAELVAYWTFNGDPNDSVGSLNWTLENGAGFCYSPFDSKENNYSLSLDGIDDYGWQDAVGPLIDAFTQKSVALWFRAVSNSGLQVLYEEGGATNGLCIRINEGLLEVGVQDNQDIFTTSTPFDSMEWTHVAATYDNGLMVLYVNGVEAASVMASFVDNEVSSHSNGAGIGGRNGQDAFDGAETGDYFGGNIDYVTLYDSVLSAEEVANLAAPPTAWSPIPVDGATHAATSVDLSWTPGINAASHNVYLSDNLDSVIAGAEDTLKGSPTISQITVGDLAPDTTYYWRVDDLEADGATIHTGDIWSFWVPPQTAYDPIPVDGAQFTGPAVTLSWTAGLGATTHTVYIGDNFDDVNNAVDGLPQTETTYDAGLLDKGKVYYWRVDEFDGTETHKGNLWSFETPPSIPITDPNLVGWWKFDGEAFDLGYVIDYSGYDHHGTPVGDLQLVAGYDGGALEFDGDGDYINIDGFKGILANEAGVQQPLTVTAWVNSTDSGDRTIVSWGTSTSGIRIDFRLFSGRLRVEHGAGNRQGDTNLIDGEWHHVALTMVEGATISYPEVILWLDGKDDTRAGTDPDAFAITARDDLNIGRRVHNDSRHFLGSLDDVRLYDKALTAEEIALVMRIDLLLAHTPSPANRATDVSFNTALSWTPGDDAAQHDIYIGTDEQAVANADASDTTGIYQGRQDLGNESFSPALALEQTFYWRIDEINSDGSISKGRLWKFTVGDFILVDDFESYTDSPPNEIFSTWVDGWGSDTNGSRVQYDADIAAGEHYVETTIVHGGSQSMPYSYDNNMKYSEATMSLSQPRDWTQQGVGMLSLWYRGYPASAGGFAEDPAGTYKMTGSGADIWTQADEFHFAFKQLGFGPCTIIAKVESVDLTNNWAKAGIMVRDTLDAGSKFAAVYITPTNDDGTPTNGCRFQARLETDAEAVSDTSVATDEQKAITAPYWIKLERGIAPLYNGYYSSDGVTWVPMSWNPQIIPTDGDDYVGLALTSHDDALTCEAVFSNVEITGTLTGEWTNQDIGITSNAREPMYVSIANQISAPAVVYNDDPNASTTDTWTEWVIYLQQFADQGIDLTDVDRFSIGFGDKNNVQAGGSGLVYFDDIRLYQVPPYFYDGDIAVYAPEGFDSLDGTWGHDNGSDAWDGTGPGEGMPGGVVSLTEDGVTFLRIQDTGDPRDYGNSDPTNRKVYLTHLTNGGLDGATLEFRARVATTPPLDDMNPDGGAGIEPWPAEGIGYHIRDNGKGMFGISDGVGIISFSLAQAGEAGFEDAATDVLAMNNLVGAEPSGDVDTGDTATALNMLAVDDVTQWNTFTINIAAGGAGTHIVSVSVNGGAAESFEVTAGSGTEGETPYITIGSSGTGGITAFDVDYITVSY